MSILENIHNWRKQQRSANHLRTLPDHTLADLGIKRANIDEYVRKSINQ